MPGNIINLKKKIIPPPVDT